MIRSDEDAFKKDLTDLIPHMRAFGRTLCQNFAEAEDVAQDALLKAWQGRDSYTPGTNLKAWVFMILRNQFYSNKRRSWRQLPLAEEAERALVATSDPDATLELDDVRRGLACLPLEQREALIMIGAGGLSYQEVAAIVGCAEGTIKSRVSRARASLAEILEQGRHAHDDLRPSEAMPQILIEFERLRRTAIAA
jgi:RNA polymerase sigma-70 factor, ECF subfamily